MHPNPAFRTQSRELQESLIEEVGFGMIFAATPDGPRVAHTALHYTRTGTVQFHLARANVLTPHLERETVLVVVNGPDGYVSPRWYSDPAQVPTWDYVALEMEGRARQMDEAELLGLLKTLAAANEAHIPGQPWTMDLVPEAKLRAMMAAITGFELEITASRATCKVSQNKRPEDRKRIAQGLEAQGAPALAQLVRKGGA